ncbi:hypothetical protein SEA_WOLLYPOG_63 [Arthrobacter phage Wollypog]|uniref:Uncharacterized protein n=1 Tax=Arthrobacter phage Wollypog TaxID=2790985 RepID=A0A7T3N3J1_9CAUD|nr:hypothetical protein PP291_gp63 [Arthrobacter phage Wollypog]QPX62614.1 hypothetical protein SEA_WOLLYPOG_63 [Arthrobacter phage Wollypog]
MSVARTKTVQKAAKDQGKCGKCGVELPKGSGYVWWTMGFRSNHKYKRCLKPECFPRPSERESSKFVTILSAQENFADNIDSLETKDDIEAAVQEVGSAVREVADEYYEALDLWPNGNEQLQEKYDHYESQASEIESWQSSGADEWDLCDAHEESDRESEEVQECEQCNANFEEWIEAIRDEAREAVDNIEQA